MWFLFHGVESEVRTRAWTKKNPARNKCWPRYQNKSHCAENVGFTDAENIYSLLGRLCIVLELSESVHVWIFIVTVRSQICPVTCLFWRDWNVPHAVRVHVVFVFVFTPPHFKTAKADRQSLDPLLTGIIQCSFINRLHFSECGCFFFICSFMHFILFYFMLVHSLVRS